MRSKLSILIEDQKRMRRRKKQSPSMVKSPPSLGTWTIGDGLMKVVFFYYTTKTGRDFVINKNS